MKKRLYFSAICLTEFAASFANALLGVLLSEYIAYYNLVSAQQGLMSVMQNIGSVAICVFAIFLAAGKIKRQYLLLFSAGTLVLSVLILGLQPPLWGLLAMYFFIGVGNAGASVVGSSLAMTLYASPAAMGMVHASYGAGALIAPVVLQGALRKLPWNVVCLFDAAILLVVFVLYVLSLIASKTVVSGISERANRISGKEICAFFAKKRNLMLIFAGFWYASFENTIGVWVIRYADHSLKLAGYGAVMLSAFWVGNLIARMTVTRMKTRTEVVFTAGIWIAIVLIAAALCGDNIIILFFAMLLSGISVGASSPQLYYLGGKWNDESATMPTAVIAIAFSVGTSVTAPITAALTTYGLIYSMIAALGYAALAGTALLPIVFRKKDAGIE